MSRSVLDDDQLGAVVARHLGTSARVEGVRRLSGGASRETWSFDAVTGDGERRALVLRRDPGGYSGQSERGVEYAVLEAAGRGGVAVPEVCFLLDADDGLGSGFVMERVEGETIPRRILRDEDYAGARERMARQCGELAARIHALDPAGLPALTVQTAADQVAQYRDLIDGLGEPHPTFELGLRWLDEHAPPGRGGTTFVHGDFRNGNFVVGPEGIRAVLDWELAHLGDPVEDLGWLCVMSWRFGVADRPVGGFGTVGDLLAGYRDAGGGAVDPDELRYWEALGTLKWGVICQLQASTHLTGVVRSVELAALGRRVAETEWDLLELIA
ncbi:MAG: phosphotransferase family protein [Acidimicrobiia bacterium]